MIKPEERYRRVCSMIDKYIDLQQAAFDRFVHLSLATVGGFLWLKIQKNADNLGSISTLVKWILPALAFVTVAEVIMLHFGWRGFRQAEADLLERPDLAPRYPHSGRRELFQSVTVAAIGVAGFIWLR